MKIMLIVAGAVTGALLTVLLLAGAASFVRAGECMRAMEWRKTGSAGHGTILALHRMQRGRKRSIFMEKSHGMGTAQSANIQNADVMEVKREELQDIDTIRIDKMQPIEKKLEEYISGKEGDLSTHLNEGYVVRVHFSMEDYSATDALKHYLKQIAELKY